MKEGESKKGSSHFDEKLILIRHYGNIASKNQLLFFARKNDPFCYLNYLKKTQNSKVCQCWQITTSQKAAKSEKCVKVQKKDNLWDM